MLCVWFMCDDCTLGTLAYTPSRHKLRTSGKRSLGDVSPPYPRRSATVVHILLQSLELHQNPFNSTTAAVAAAAVEIVFYFITLGNGCRGVIVRTRAHTYVRT